MHNASFASGKILFQVAYLYKLPNTSESKVTNILNGMSSISFCATCDCDHLAPKCRKSSTSMSHSRKPTLDEGLLILTAAAKFPMVY